MLVHKVLLLISFHYLLNSNLDRGHGFLLNKAIRDWVAEICSWNISAPCLHIPASLEFKMEPLTSFSKWDVSRRDLCYFHVRPKMFFYDYSVLSSLAVDTLGAKMVASHRSCPERFSAESSALDFWARNESLPCPATHFFGFSSFPYHTVSLPIRYFSNVFTIRMMIQIFIRIPNIALETILDIKIPHSYLLIPVIKMCIWKRVGCSVWQHFAKYSCGFWNAWTIPTLWELRRRKCRSSLPSELCLLCTIQGRRNIYEYCAGEASFNITACEKVIISLVQIGLWVFGSEPWRRLCPGDLSQLLLLTLCHAPALLCGYTAFTHVGCTS